MGWFYFYLGITVGALLGMGVMCLLSYAKDPQAFSEGEGELLSKPHKPL